MEVRVHRRLDEVARADWDALLDDEATPFLRWDFLQGLEEAGCVRPRAGWQPMHLSLWDEERMLAAAPAYAKSSSEGDFSRDWGWAEAAMRAGIPYYPKLVVGVPFTPATGRRILCAPGTDRADATAALMAGAMQLCKEAELSSLHVLFPTEAEALDLEAAGLARRMDFQYHWHNRGYKSYEDWLQSLDAKKRHMVRRERKAAAEQGITIRTVPAAEIGAADIFRFYRAGVERHAYWGRQYLSERFFALAIERMPEHLEVVAAMREGRLIAGAFNIASKTHLYGRYWGAHEEHPFLHFHVCLYHSIEDCIQRGLQVFEGGASGEHKHARGFEIAPTWSAHAFVDPRLDAGVRDYLARELAVRQSILEGK